MNARIKSPLETEADVAEAYDAWAVASDSREMRTRKLGGRLGTLVTLFERGQKIAEGRGPGLVNAIADALEAFDALQDEDPDAEENRWNERFNSGMPTS